MAIWTGKNRQPDPQQERIGVKGDPTPDAEYGDEPEHSSNHINQDSSDPRKLYSCTECENQRKVSREEADSRKEITCMKMTFNPEEGEVPCGGKMEVVDQ